MLGIVGALIAATSVPVNAQPYPSKPVRWIVPFAPGGPADVIARLLQPKLAEHFGQAVIIDNRAGAGSNIGHELAARAAPDGYTILYVVPNVITNPSLTKGAVDPFRELTPVTQLTAQSYVLMAAPNFAPRTVADIMAAAREKAGSVTCAAGGGLPAFGCEWLRTMARADIVHVPYKGNAPAMTDLIGGQVTLLIDLFNTALPQIRAGKVRAVALTGPERGPPFPELPVIAETLPGFVLVGWHGVMAPAGVPAPIIERLNEGFAASLKDPAIAKRITESHIQPSHTSAMRFGQILQEDFTKYARIIKEAGIKPE
jgi:tripartite-type tricarboxylate transporter receptor subunit TctC